MMPLTCAACGQPMASTAAFCGHCGRPVQRACSQCGGSVGPQARFCGTCGADVVALAGVPAVATPPQPPSLPAPLPALPTPLPLSPARQPTPPWAAPAAAPAPLSVRSASRRPLAIAGVGVAVVAVLVAVTVLGDRLPWHTTSLPVAAVSADAPTVIDVPTDVIGNTTVRAAGATVVADDVKIVVPQGAVSTDTDIVVQRLNAPFHMDDGAAAASDALDARPIGPAFDLGPAGTQFGQPVDVTLPYDASIVPDGTDPNLIVVAYYTGTHWAVAGGKADVAAHTVTVRLQAFSGLTAAAVLLTFLVGIVVNRAITYNETKKNPNAYNDQVVRGVAKQWITNDPAVKEAAAGATAGGISLSDPASLAAYMGKQGATPVEVTLTPGGSPRKVTYFDGENSNWQKPVDYLARNMKGDCTSTTNAMVSVFRSLGYKAKGVEGYAGDKNHPHAWGEVLIGDKAYMIDQNGMLQLLPGAIGLNHLIRADKNDPRDYMWDETGQEIYKGNWWGPTVLTIDPTLIADGQIGENYDFKASATGIPDTAESVQFEWYQDSVPNTEWTPGGVLPPYQEPLTTRATFSFNERGSYLIKVALFATTEGVRAQLARASVRVRIKSATASPSAVSSPSAVASTSVSAGYWQFVETKNFPDPPPVVKTDYDVTADGAHFSRVVSRPDEKPATWAFSCTWSISSPADPGRLTPGSSVEGTASCTDTSDAVGFYSSGVSFAIEPLGIPGYDGGTWGPAMTFGLRETKTLKGSLIVPAGPRASAPWNGQICVQFQVGQIGYTQRIYKWVPGGE